MNILELIGLNRKKRKFTVGLTGENANPEQEKKRRQKNLIIKTVISVLFLAMIGILYPREFSRDFSYQLMEPWKQDDLTAPFDFSVLKSEAELDREIQEIRNQTPPVFHIRTDIREVIDNRIDSVEIRLTPVLEAYVRWQTSERNNRDVQADSLAFVETRDEANLFFTDSTLNHILDSYYQKSTISNRVFVLNDVKGRLEHLISEVLRDGIVNINRNDIGSSEISIRNLRDRTERILRIENVRDLSEAQEYVGFRLTRMLRDDAAQVGIQLFKNVIEPNFIFNEEQTQVRIDEAIDGISLTKGAIAAGQVIIRRGDLIDETRMSWLKSLDAAQASRASNFELFLRFVGDMLVITMFFLTFLTYMYLYRKKIFDDNGKFSLVIILIALVVGASATVNRLENIADFIVPLALTPILLTIFFDSRVGLMATMCIALITSQIIGYNFEFLAATMVASSMGVYSVRDVRKRNQFFLTTPGLVFLSYGLVLLGFTLARSGAWDVLGTNIGVIFINILLIAILTYPFIYLLEKLFVLTTDVTLYELNDNNNAILKSLMYRAPGSFQHSIQVANLTEAAASAIGANPLLARVGALYHDIGKMEKPQYYIENQSGKSNEHDKLKPSMSAKVIKDHVKAGVKIARDENLPPIIIQFIETHHGNSLVKYFYDKAVKEAGDGVTVEEDFFRYEGPLPETRETGILLLADCIEAASRSMTDPTYKKLENLVDRMVEERVAEGQLNECPLTFKDLTLVKSAFLQILVAMYHGRVKYPGQEEKEAQELARELTEARNKEIAKKAAETENS